MAQTMSKPQCRALLRDQSTPCSKIAAGSSPYCSKHGQEYAVLTREYKKLSANNGELDPGKLSRNEIRALDVSEAKRVVKANKRYLVSLEAECEARTTQHIRFFGEVDPGHSKWLEILRRKQQRALTQLKLFDEAGFNIGPPRTVEESGLFNFTPVHSVRREEPKDDLIPDLVILVSSIIGLGILVSFPPLEAQATLWAFLQNVFSWLSTILQWLWTLAILTIRVLWGLTVVW